MGNNCTKVRFNVPSIFRSSYKNLSDCIKRNIIYKNTIHIFINQTEENNRVSSLSKKKRVSRTQCKHSQTVWPLPVVEYIFLPEFKVKKVLKNSDIVIISSIAKGAFGKVFKVKDIKTEKTYAMKILQKSQIIEENAVLQVKDEIRIQTICGHHQFIVNCIFSWQSYSQLFMIFEYKSGGELLHLIEKYGPLSEEIARIYVAEIAVAIDFLHNAGVIHRDLKSENILLDENYHISLIDFGLSKWLSRGSKTNTICGTDLYMAPEILKCEGYSHAADWWSFGVICCYMLTNEFPKIKETKVHLPENITLSTASKDLLLRLLTYDPCRRLRSLYTLKTIAFFKNFDFKSILERKINPKEMLHELHTEKNKNEDMFHDF